MDVGVFVVQLVHVAGGAAWFGGSLFANVVLIPYIGRQSPDRRGGLVAGMILGPERIMIAAALTAALSGLVRGVGFGRVTSLEVLGTAYGVVWLASILVAIAVFAVGGRVTSPAARSLAAAGAERRTSGGWRSCPLRLGFRLELAGITTILVLMVALSRL